MDSWPRYERWNEAVASAVFPVLSEPAPVYLDLEEETLSQIAREAGSEHAPRDGLREAVRGVTVAGESFSLNRLWRAQRQWRSGRDYTVPPPSLAFLALTALAAEDMGSSDDGFNANNYYSRLCVLLGLDPNHQPIRQQYQQRAEGFWGDLNRWLDGLDGMRGTPTAYALTFRYVGLPLSQALVREGDRRKFPLFFAQYGLAAGMDLAPEVLQRYLEAWFNSEGCPASVALKRLWSKPSTHERIATVAALELMGWDGAIAAAHVSQAPALQRVGLIAQVHQGFLGSGVDIALAVRSFGIDAFDGRMEVEASGGEWLPLTLTPSVANVWRTSFTSGLDIASVLEGVVKLRQEGADGQVHRHHPRSVVPLVFDEMQSAFVEQERLQLNVDSMLLVREKAQGRPIASRVADALRTCARPGFRVEGELDGLPAGWVLISGVQLFGAPSSGTFNELVPLARDQLTVAGGMRIPSRVRKWSALAAPEIRASVESVDGLRLVLTDLDTEREQAWTTQGGALVVSLDDLALPVGDYRAALFAGDSRNPLQQVTIRLRSADGVDSAWHLAPRLTYTLSDPGGPMGAITAAEEDADLSMGRFVDGALALGSSGVEAMPAPSRPIWSAPKPVTQVIMPVRIGSPDAQSCVVTGAHYLEYPTYFGGWGPKFIEGVCKYCGLVKRSPGWPRKKDSRPGKPSASHIEVADLPPVESASTRLWDAALDALMHLGGGTAASLTGVASQIDGSALFTTSFPVRLETLGHLAIERSPDGSPTRWEISPSCLVPVPEGLELIGFWPGPHLAELLSLLEPFGGRLVHQPKDGRPSRRRIEGVGADEVEAHLNDKFTLALDAASAILDTLPALSSLRRALPREPMPGFNRAERYDVTSSSWLGTNDVSSPGAYRLSRGFERIHLLRSAEDVEAGLAARGSVYLVKHLAANLSGRSLAIYLPTRQAIVVPRGCDLPGLYARAAVLASGELPTSGKINLGELKRDCLVYSGISQDQADLLVTLLSR